MSETPSADGAGETRVGLTTVSSDLTDIVL